MCKASAVGDAAKSGYIKGNNAQTNTGINAKTMDNINRQKGQKVR